jgi:hypothetical protein
MPLFICVSLLLRDYKALAAAVYAPLLPLRPAGSMTCRVAASITGNKSLNPSSFSHRNSILCDNSPLNSIGAPSGPLVSSLSFGAPYKSGWRFSKSHLNLTRNQACP